MELGKEAGSLGPEDLWREVVKRKFEDRLGRDNGRMENERVVFGDKLVGSRSGGAE